MDVYEILPGRLYQSGGLTPTMSYLEKGITAVVALDRSMDAYIPHREGFVYVSWPIQDGPLPEMKVLEALVDFIDRLILAQHKVLVHCAAGLNRSGLVCACVLLMNGKTGKAAIEAIRAARGPDALSNPQFAAWLETQGEWEW